MQILGLLVALGFVLAGASLPQAQSELALIGFDSREVYHATGGVFRVPAGQWLIPVFELAPSPGQLVLRIKASGVYHETLPLGDPDIGQPVYIPPPAERGDIVQVEVFGASIPREYVIIGQDPHPSPTRGYFGSLEMQWISLIANADPLSAMEIEHFAVSTETRSWDGMFVSWANASSKTIIEAGYLARPTASASHMDMAISTPEASPIKLGTSAQIIAYKCAFCISGGFNRFVMGSTRQTSSALVFPIDSFDILVGDVSLAAVMPSGASLASVGVSVAGSASVHVGGGGTSFLAIEASQSQPVTLSYVRGPTAGEVEWELPVALTNIGTCSMHGSVSFSTPTTPNRSWLGLMQAEGIDVPFTSKGTEGVVSCG